jgi:predicted transcriptional regulator
MEGYSVRRSKLEMYMDILEAIDLKGQLKLTHILYKTALNTLELKNDLSLLISKDLVEERMLNDSLTVYVITKKGRNLLQIFKEFNNILPIEEEM